MLRISGYECSALKRTSLSHASQGSKNVAEEGDDRGLELEDGEETYEMVLSETVNTLEPLNSQYHWLPA